MLIIITQILSISVHFKSSGLPKDFEFKIQLTRRRLRQLSFNCIPEEMASLFQDSTIQSSPPKDPTDCRPLMEHVVEFCDDTETFPLKGPRFHRHWLCARDQRIILWGLKCPGITRGNGHREHRPFEIMSHRIDDRGPVDSRILRPHRLSGSRLLMEHVVESCDDTENPPKGPRCHRPLVESGINESFGGD
ncbi:hypothetical protein CDAR_561491 [Caerostris darwini]|uniref:Uncharacterized protein n=1 Tax=Caerostris darwini TaxID=1538125 RepID=A0AAV4SNH1_9ARAC|nr:hypothetical protein CDAR_561491 [Caerostris darwini]